MTQTPLKINNRDFYEKFHKKQEFPWISRTMQKERLRLIKELINRCDVDSPKNRFLLVGCGSGDDMSLNPSAFGIDLSMQSLLNTKNRFAFSRVSQGDALALPFLNNSFSTIVCSEVIEHLPNRRQFYSEAFRILEENGVLILTTPNWKNWYGLVRFLIEGLTGKPVTSADQPIDNWNTLKNLTAEIGPQFIPVIKRGIWFYPPLGKGHIALPFPFSAAIYYLFLPFDRILQKTLPGWGHMVAVVARKQII